MLAIILLFAFSVALNIAFIICISSKRSDEDMETILMREGFKTDGLEKYQL